MSLTYDEVRHALAGERRPCAFVDLDAFDRNLNRHLAILKPRKTPMRLATKSLRVPALITRAMQQEGTSGLMCFDIDEAGDARSRRKGTTTARRLPDAPASSPHSRSRRDGAT
jgi:D-serine deaminase-like pyridoxal phosphate-dependent protein